MRRKIKTETCKNLVNQVSANLDKSKWSTRTFFDKFCNEKCNPCFMHIESNDERLRVKSEMDHIGAVEFALFVSREIPHETAFVEADVPVYTPELGHAMDVFKSVIKTFVSQHQHGNTTHIHAFCELDDFLEVMNKL